MKRIAEIVWGIIVLAVSTVIVIWIPYRLIFLRDYSIIELVMGVGIFFVWHKGVKIGVSRIMGKPDKIKKSVIPPITNQKLFDEFTKNYYKKPSPSDILSSIRYVENDEELTSDISLWPIAGFYSEVFRANPDMLPGWINEIEQLSSRGKTFLRCSIMAQSNIRIRSVSEQKNQRRIPHPA